MKRWALLLAITLGSGTVVEAEVVTVENQALRLEIQKSPAPFVNRLVHKASGQAVVAEPAVKSLFSIVLVKDDGGQEAIDSAQAGQSSVSVDQTVSGAGAACYSTGHGHAPGPGLYQSQEFIRLLEALRAHGKRHTPEFVLFHEEPHEQLIPCLDGFHVREYFEKRWYRSQPGAVGIPLFSYLYHEYALGYGGDSAGLSKHNSRWQVRCHAMNLVAGRTPGGAVWSSHASMFDAHPDQIALLRSHSRLLKTRARDFLMLGRMLHPYELDVPTLAVKAAVHVGGKWQEQAIPTPAILTSSWQSPAGNVGHLFVNVAETSQPLKVRLDARNATWQEPCDAAVYRSSPGGDFQPLWQGVALPKEYVCELGPLEVLFVELTHR